MTDGIKDKYRQGIIRVLSAHPEVEKAVLFGSRAAGTFRPTSDLDIALFGNRLTFIEQAKISLEIEDLDMPQKIDLLIYQKITSQKLQNHINKHGVIWYKKGQPGTVKMVLKQAELVAGEGLPI